MSAAAPRDTLAAPVAVHVTLRCHVGILGRLARCVVAEETPAGLGVGDLALRTAEKMRVSPLAWFVRDRDGLLTIPVDLPWPGEPPPP